MFGYDSDPNPFFVFMDPEQNEIFADPKHLSAHTVQLKDLALDFYF
jgi:hypothetical protein